MLETVVLVTDGSRPDQDYERMATWINILGSPEFIATLYEYPEYDVFGVLPNGVEFASEEALSRIVGLFNQERDKIALIYANCGAYFINKRIIPTDMKIESLDQLNEFIFANGLRSIKIENNIFK